MILHPPINIYFHFKASFTLLQANHGQDGPVNFILNHFMISIYIILKDFIMFGLARSEAILCIGSVRPSIISCQLSKELTFLSCLF